MLNPLPPTLHLRSGDPANALIVFKNRPAAGDTVTIDGQAYTYGTDWTGEVAEIGIVQGTGAYNAALAAERFAQMHNADFNARGQHSQNQPVKSTYAVPYGPNVRIIACKTGTGGNSIAMSTSNTNAFTVPANLTGGA